MKTFRRGLTFRKKRTKRDFSGLKAVVIWLVKILVVVFLGYATAKCFFCSLHMSGDAMEDTLSDGDLVCVNRLKMKIGKLEEGDVIAFLPKGNIRSHYYIRRVVAIPGDTVQIMNGILYVNNEPSTLISADEKISDAGNAEDLITLGEDEYFVLGDNFNESEDSRYSNIGVVEKDDIYGKVWIRLKPLSGFGSVD